VLKKGYSKRDTRKWVLRTGVLNKGTQVVHSKKDAQKGYSNTGLQKGYSKRVLNGAEKLLRVRAAVFAGYWRAVHGSPGQPSVGFVLHGTVEYSQGTHGVLTWAVDRTVRCAPPPRSWDHGTQCSACVRHDGVYSKVGERHRTEGDLACDARRVLDGYSRAEYRVHRSAPVRRHCGCVVGLRYAL
jgi:hypothetical protein